MRAGRLSFARSAVITVAGALALFAVLVAAVNLALYAVLFGPVDGLRRLGLELQAVVLAHEVETGALRPRAAFVRLHGRPPSQARAVAEARLAEGKPIPFDAVAAQLAIERHGAVDARTLPPGAYLAASPVGPDAWPWRLLSAGFFPKHGYLLIVPPPEDGRYPEAVEATASLREDFRSGGDHDDLFALVMAYRPGALDFPRAGEPVHELHRLQVPPMELAAVQRRVEASAARIRDSERRYRLFQRNSNSAMACLLRAAGLTDRELQPLTRPIVRLRLPGVASSRACVPLEAAPSG